MLEILQDFVIKVLEFASQVGTDIKALRTSTESKGVELTANQASSTIFLKDANGNTISSLNVGFLNNEGTTIEFNAATEEIELKDEDGNVISSFPASSLVANMPASMTLTDSTLELRNNANDVIDSVDLTIENIQDLQDTLNNKLTKSGNADELIKGDDTPIETTLGKHIDDTNTIYANCADLISEGYTTANKYAQGAEIVCRNDSTNGYRRYEKMSDDDNDWMVFDNTNGWQVLPLT